MPNGEGVEFLAMLGSDLRRVWWGAWGDPRGFVPRMADYFKLCNIAKSDAQVLDQIGEQLEPKQVGSWIGVWGGKVTTGWHFMDPHDWPKVEQMFGTHEAKYAVKKWVDDHHITRVERFSQSIGDSPFSEIEFAIPGDSVDAQVVTMSAAFDQLTGAPLTAAITDRLRMAQVPRFGLAVRIRGGHIVRVGGIAPGLADESALALCTDANVTADPKLTKLLNALGSGIARVEYGRAGERAGVDMHIVPGDPAPKQRPPATEPPLGEAN
jgi:hypothetical protein